MSFDVEVLRKTTTDAALQTAAAQARAKRVEAELTDYAAKLGEDALAILKKYGADMPTSEAKRLLRRLVLRMLIQGSGDVQAIGKVMPQLLDLFSPEKPKAEGEQVVVVEP